MPHPARTVQCARVNRNTYIPHLPAGGSLLQPCESATPALEFERMEKRAASILRRLKSCEQYTASAGSVMTRRDGNGIRDWVLSVHLVLRKVGLTGAAVLTFRLTRQQHSQANGFKQIAIDVTRLRAANGLEAISASECELAYLLSLDEFLRLMTARSIPDDYRDQIAA